MAHYHSEQVADVNGIQINYDSFGEHGNPPIILIMGLATQMIFWQESFCQALAEKGFWVIRFDNRDIGKSTWLDDKKVPGQVAMLANMLFSRKLQPPYSLDDMADDTLALMDHLNIEAAHIVGVSMGGMIAQCMAIKAPQRVLRLTSIMSTTGDRKLPTAKAKVGMILAKPVPNDPEGYERHSLNVWRILHGEKYPFDYDSVRALLNIARQRGLHAPGIIRQFCAILSASDRTESLSKLSIPAQVIHGDIDPLIPVECGIATAKVIPNAKLHIFEGMGHTLPEQLWAEIIDLLATN